MTEQAPPGFQQNADHSAKLMRQILQFMGGAGNGALAWAAATSSFGRGVVLRPTHMKVSQSSGLTMSVAGGACIIPSTRAADDGAYFCFNNGAKTIALAAAPSSGNSRYDLVIARVRDSEFSGSDEDWIVDKVTGTAATTGTETVPTLSGVDDAVALARVHLNSSGFQAILDLRHVACIDGMPIGSMIDWCATSIPHGYLLCDGAAYSTTDYPELFEIIGYTYGGSSGTFQVPDMRGRTTFCLDNMFAAGSTAGDGGQMTPNGTLGDESGSQFHTLTQAELPATVTLTTTTGGSTHTSLAAGSGSGSGSGAVALGSATPIEIMPPFRLVLKAIRAY